jgi:DNA-binding response OmpR family regulator
MEHYIIVNDAQAPLGAEFVVALARQGWLVSIATTPEAIRRQVDRHGPPALLICSGCELAEEEEALMLSLKHQGRTRILALIDGEESSTANGEQGFWLKADDFVVWPVTGGELVMRVRRLFRSRQAGWTATVRDLNGNEKIVPALSAGSQWGRTREDDWKYRLSAVERSIFQKLEEARGDVVALEELAACIDASTESARINALRVHINRLRRKIEETPNQPRYVLTVRGVGYRLGARTQQIAW